MIYLKSTSEIAIMRQNGGILRECFEIVEKMVHPGVKKKEIDETIDELIKKRGAKAAFKGFQGCSQAIRKT